MSPSLNKEGKKRRIGILGGTFDPIHTGHLMLAEQAASHAGLEKVLLMPAGHSYFKDGRPDAVSAPFHRLAMVKLAARLSPVFAAEDLEILREGNTYTCDTLPILEERYPDAELCLIVGADTVMGLRRWKHPEIIFEKSTILAAARPDQTDDAALLSELELIRREYGARTEIVPIVPNAVSSSQIRRMTAEGKSIRFLVPAPVESYIRTHGLYSPSGDGRLPGRTEGETVMSEKLDPKALRDFRTSLVADMMPQLPFPRYLHTIGVACTAQLLAEKHGISEQQAFTAGLYHDCAKYLPVPERIALAKRGGYPVSEAEMRNPELLHAKAGAELARSRYGVEDPEVIDAIRYHSTGHPGMTMLEKIIYIADYIEPGRTQAPRLSDLRREAFEDIDTALLHILEDTVSYLNASGKEKDPLTEETLAYYHAARLQ